MGSADTPARDTQAQRQRNQPSSGPSSQIIDAHLASIGRSDARLEGCSALNRDFFSESPNLARTPPPQQRPIPTNADTHANNKHVSHARPRGTWTPSTG